MREEISEPTTLKTGLRTRRERGPLNELTGRIMLGKSLPAEVVDAAFAEEIPVIPGTSGSRRTHGAHSPPTASTADRSDLIRGLSDQLAMLDAQREQIQRLLAAADPSSPVNE